jgi:hypothetical protein
VTRAGGNTDGLSVSVDDRLSFGDGRTDVDGHMDTHMELMPFTRKRLSIQDPIDKLDCESVRS